MMICECCGITLEVMNAWRPNCKLYGGDVCATCCYHCEYHTAACPGTWQCTYKTPEERKAIALRKKTDEANAEIARISDAYHQERKRKAREWYIKQAQQRKRENARRNTEER